MRIVASARKVLIQHAETERPNQACGLICMDDNDTIRYVHRAKNAGAWPYGFQIAPESQLEAYTIASKHAWKVNGVYHCHTVSAAIPTGRDLKRPVPKDFLYVVVSVLYPDAPEVRAFYLEEEGVREVDLVPMEDSL